jgi:hypothetical protein
MHVRTDYETEDILAVFDDPETARKVIRRLRAELGDPHRVVGVPLEPGRYQLADFSLQEVVHGAMSTARMSVPLGALAGLGLGAVAIPGVGLAALAGLALAGAVGGFVVGAMTGAIKRTRWDRDPAGFLDVPPGSHYTLVVVDASPALARRETSHVRGILVRSGAIAFLDPSAYYASRESTPAGTAI